MTVVRGAPSPRAGPSVSRSLAPTGKPAAAMRSCFIGAFLKRLSLKVFQPRDSTRPLRGRSMCRRATQAFSHALKGTMAPPAI
jgi:hypothetical protein